MRYAAMMTPYKPYDLNLRGRLVTIDRPWVMGIVNITPDSFYSGSRVTDEQTLITLFYYDDRPLADIAYILDGREYSSSNSAIATRLHRIRRKLYLLMKHGNKQ